jgi:hypothetical protein
MPDKPIAAVALFAGMDVNGNARRLWMLIMPNGRTRFEVNDNGPRFNYPGVTTAWDTLNITEDEFHGLAHAYNVNAPDDESEDE